MKYACNENGGEPPELRGSMTKSKLYLLAGISFAAMCQPVCAQQTATTEAEATTADPDIVVTGTRITSNGNALPTPVTVVSRDSLLRTSPSSVSDALKKLPAFALSRGSAIQGDATDNATGNYLNLRGFGIQRNLILLDGHRVAPTSYTGAVDANILPQMLMQRVDVVTGGASAVYGSDAVSGVVNFVLDRKFEGLKVEGNSGISSRGDAYSWRAAAAFGTDFANDRGHFMASYEHFQQDGFVKEARKSGRTVYAIAGSGTQGDPFRLISDARNAQISFRGSIFSSPLAGQVFTGPGVTGPFVHGTPQGGSLESGGEGFYGKGSSGTADVKTDQAYARLDYELTDGINAFVQGVFAKSRNFNYFYPNLVLPLAVGTDNAFLAPATQAAIGDPLFIFGRVLDDPDHRIAVQSDSKTWIAAGGLDGKIGGMNWNVYYQHGVSSTVNSFINNTINGNLYAALDAVDEGSFRTGTANGNIVCRATLTNPGSQAGCVPLNAFGAPLSTQQAALDYVFGTSRTRPEFTLDNIEASLSGTAFDNWAGPVRFAISGEYRWTSLDVTTNAPATLTADCTGIRFNCTPGATPYFSNAQVTPISVSQNVKEAALEVEFPLLKDSGLGSASLNGAVRYTDYSTSGGVTTWKIGGEWVPIDGLRFRGTYSRDIRAPSLYDLFQPATVATSGYSDAHTGFNGIIPTETAGNSSLTPEVARTLTAGVVFAPSSLRGLSLSIDYYRINMSNAISEVDGRLATVQNLCEEAGGTGPFCSLYERPLDFSDRSVANAPTLVRSTKLNAASLKTWGIDAELNYSFQLGSDGQMSLRGLAGYQPEFTSVLLPGTDPQILAGAAAIQQSGGVPKLRLTAFINYTTSNFSIDVMERWRSSLRQSTNEQENSSPGTYYAIPRVPSVAYTDLTFTAFIGKDKDKQLFLSVQNLFDKQPPAYVIAGFSGTPGFQYPSVVGDDVIGRYFTIGGRFKF
jgi:outer membrane receptor protein involved in Fe transport